MASFCTFPGSLLYYNTHGRKRRISFHKPLYATKSTIIGATTTNDSQSIIRRSANYQSSLWSNDYIQSLTSKYKEEHYEARSHILKKKVRVMISKDVSMDNLLFILNLVDDLQRLGISYHFEDIINSILERIYFNYYKHVENWNKMDLNLRALGFRLLRQHGYHVDEDIFQDFENETICSKERLYDEIIGMLNLYEASYLSIGDENILDRARDFTYKFLREILDTKKIIEESMLAIVSHALELPLHWRVPRIETRWFINVYETRSDANHVLVELAKLDFNMVQIVHQEDLKSASRWWKSIGWDTKFSFARDRLVENFLWTIGTNYLPQFKGRTTMTKVNALITTIDDVYDVYGTLDELKLFTEVVTRWDINMIDELPDYMKICFLGLYNSINEIAYDTLKDDGFCVIVHLKKAWADLCKSYLVEALWYNTRHIPTLEEYLNNSCLSIDAPVILMHAYFLTSSNISKEALQCIESCGSVVRYSSIILRLANDLGTSSDEMQRGDISKSIQCYMHESGASEEEARTHIKSIISDTWKKLNKERHKVDSSFSRAFIEFATNLARMAQFMYNDRDDMHGCPNLTKSHILSLLINPIPGI